MATAPDDITPLDMRERLARIDKMQAEIQKVMQDTRLATPQMFFQGGLATAALIGAGAALAKLFF
jgi:hypothetical protein